MNLDWERKSREREGLDEAPIDLVPVSSWVLDGSQLGVIRPGDTLVLHAAQTWTQEWAAWAKQFVEARLPGVHALVLTGVDHLAVYRGAEPLFSDVAVGERGFVGLTADQYRTLSLVDRGLVDAWVTENGVDPVGCGGIRIDPDGAAHFDVIFDPNVVPPSWYWVCVPEPTRPPDVAWQPWDTSVEDVAS